MAATTRNIAYNTILAQPVERIDSEDHSLREYLKFKKSIVRAAKSLPTELGGGANGHAWLVLSGTEFSKLDGAKAQVIIDHPGLTPNIKKDMTSAEVALATKKKKAELEGFYTQEG